MRLKPNQRCPIHRGRRDCCGRSQEIPRGRLLEPKYKVIGDGVRQYPDGRILRTPAALNRVKDRLLQRGETCVGCREPFDDYREVELCHRKPKGMNGWKRHDATENLVLGHKALNRDCGSMDLDVYLATKYRPEICRSGI